MLRRVVLGSVVFAILLVSCISIELLNFVNVKSASSETVGYITNEKTDLLFDATATSPRVVYFSEKSSIMDGRFSFACHVNKQNSPLKSVSMCCRSGPKDSQSTCNPVDLTRREGVVTCMQTEFNYIVDQLNGVLFFITVKGDVMSVRPVGGLFHCSVTGSSGTSIQSNEIDVRDATYYTEKLPRKPTGQITTVPSIDPGNFPFAFRCMDVDSSTKTWPEWINFLSSSYWPYEWAYCEVSGSINAQTCADRSIQLPESDHIKFLNGTMYLLNKRIIETKKVAILCKPKGVKSPLKTFAGQASELYIPEITEALSVLPMSSAPLRKLEALTATEEFYSMRSGSSTSGFMLKALYRGPASGFEAKWTKGGKPLPKPFATMYSYQLPATVTSDMKGTYMLTVTSNEDPSDVLRFSYHINVVEPPVFTSPSCLSGLLYVMEGTDLNLTCPVKFQSVPKAVVGVNLYESDSPEKLKELLKSSIILDSKLKNLQFDFGLEAKELTAGYFSISLFNMEDGQNFQLSAKLESPEGDSHLSSSMRVVPTPRLIKVPSSSNCVEECDTEPYNVTCTVDPERIKLWKEQFDISVVTGWIIQGQWTTLKLDPQGIGRFMDVGSDGSTLTVWPRGNPALKDDLHKTNSPVDEDVKDGEPTTTSASLPPHTTLKGYMIQEIGEAQVNDLVLQCWIRLYVHSPEARFDPPPSDRVLRRVSRQQQQNAISQDSTPRLIYDSRWEPNKALAHQLTVTRTFTSDPKPVSANLAWIAAVVLGIILVIAVIALSIWLYTRDRGETYMLYDKERAHGNDPIQEMKEKETFQTYQRQEEQPIASSRYSLNDGSMHVDSEDEGELDQYGDDFNEEGSFIHAYSNDHTRSTHAIPPDSVVRGLPRSPPNNTAV